MLYATGDLHGDFSRLKEKEISRLKKGDTLFCCGDFGFVWDGSRTEQKFLKKIGKRKFQVCFVDGTHDNYDLLARYPVEPFCGAKARHISGGLWHLLRGEIYQMEGKRIFAMGGGESEDLDIRIPNVSWWEAEMPSLEEIAYAREQLRQSGNEVDYIISHECTNTIKDFIDMENDHISPLSAFFEEVGNTCAFRKWLFGCYHLDKRVSEHYMALYKSVLALE